MDAADAFMSEKHVTQGCPILAIRKACGKKSLHPGPDPSLDRLDRLTAGWPP
jgi:hypothetical protein